MKLFEQCERCVSVRARGNPCAKNLYEQQDDSWICSGYESKSRQRLVTYVMLGANYGKMVAPDSQQKDTNVAKD